MKIHEGIEGGYDQEHIQKNSLGMKQEYFALEMGEGQRDLEVEGVYIGGEDTWTGIWP